jgi:hypothetical protein
VTSGERRESETGLPAPPPHVGVLQMQSSWSFVNEVWIFIVDLASISRRGRA